MIHDHDRRFYIGGSDASKVLGNHNTKTYKAWWLSKLGISDHTSSDNQYTAAGTRYEHPILDCYATTTETTQEPTEEKPTETTQETTTETGKETISYTITEDQHTQTGAKIWIVKPEKELNKTDFAEVKRKLATIQGYYSTFKHGFIFKYNPTEALQTG